MIENLESESDNTEVQVATLDMSREELNNSPIPGQVSRPSIIDLAEAVYKPDEKSPPADKLKLKEEHIRYSFSKFVMQICSLIIRSKQKNNNRTLSNRHSMNYNST